MSMLEEAAFKERPTQRKKIRDYLRKIHETIQQMIDEYEDGLNIVIFQRILSQFESVNVGPKGIKIGVKFIYNDNIGVDAGWVNQKSKVNFDLVINMIPHIHTEKVPDDRMETVTEVDWAKFFDTFIHEYTHILDVLKAPKGISPLTSYQSRPYFNRPYEQRAWAEGYLEWLRHKLETADASEILKYLRNKGLVNPALELLKHKNPMAWKQIMKHAILGTIRDLEGNPSSTTPVGDRRRT